MMPRIRTNTGQIGQRKLCLFGEAFLYLSPSVAVLEVFTSSSVYLTLRVHVQYNSAIIAPIFVPLHRDWYTHSVSVHTAGPTSDLLCDGRHILYRQIQELQRRVSLALCVVFGVRVCVCIVWCACVLCVVCVVSVYFYTDSWPLYKTVRSSRTFRWKIFRCSTHQRKLNTQKF